MYRAIPIFLRVNIIMLVAGAAGSTSSGRYSWPGDMHRQAKIWKAPIYFLPILFFVITCICCSWNQQTGTPEPMFRASKATIRYHLLKDLISYLRLTTIVSRNLFDRIGIRCWMFIWIIVGMLRPAGRTYLNSIKRRILPDISIIWCTGKRKFVRGKKASFSKQY
jgi:hypothetical protein